MFNSRNSKCPINLHTGIRAGCVSANAAHSTAQRVPIFHFTHVFNRINPPFKEKNVCHYGKRGGTSKCPSTVQFVSCLYVFYISFCLHCPSSNEIVSLLFAALPPFYAGIVSRLCSTAIISLPRILLPSFQINPRFVLAVGCCNSACRDSRIPAARSGSRRFFRKVKLLPQVPTRAEHAQTSHLFCRRRFVT